MKPALTITPPAWMRETALLNVMRLLNADGLNAMMVGGCIRNHLYGLDVTDIDIATRLKPDEVTGRLSAQGVKVIPTGIKHGTVTAFIHHKHFEITTLRHDHNTDGRHADVTFDADWTDDAKRRDFTINALYATCDGSIYDPLGTGLNDVYGHVVRFIDDPAQRITEDYLRILRFIRFSSRFNKGNADQASLDACRDLRTGIKNLSDERIVDELYKILSLNEAQTACTLMLKADIFPIEDRDIEALGRLVTLQYQLNCVDLDARYACVGFDKTYIKNTRIIQTFEKLQKFQNQWDGNIKLALYRFERSICIQGLLILKSQGHAIDDYTISTIMSTPAPIMPIIAQDVMDMFKIAQGPYVGKYLRMAESLWIDSGFQDDRETILSKMKQA